MDCPVHTGHVKQLVNFFESVERASHEKETRLTLRSSCRELQSDKKENRPTHIITPLDGENTFQPSSLITISNLIKPCAEQSHLHEEILFFIISMIILDKLDRLHSERFRLLQVVPLVSSNNDEFSLDTDAPDHICSNSAEMPVEVFSSSQHAPPKMSRPVKRPRRASKIPIRITRNKIPKDSKPTTISQLLKSILRLNDSPDVNKRPRTVRFNEDVSLYCYHSQSPIVHKILNLRPKKTLKVPL